MQKRLIQKNYTALICSQYDTIYYPASGVIKQNSIEPEKWVIEGGVKKLVSEHVSFGEVDDFDCLTHYKINRSTKYDKES